MQYSSISIYFMSGTGNSYRAAAWMAETADKKGITSKLHQIQRCCGESEPVEDTRELFGMVFPTHAFTAPWQVIRFALRLPDGRGKHAFVAATRGGTRIASVPFPGMEGTAGYLIALILFLKGYIVNGITGLDLPSNWMAVHPGLNTTDSRFIIDRAKVKACCFMENILSGKRVYRGIISLFFGLILSPVSLAYLFLGRFFLAKLFFASMNCTGCGLCAKSCPVNAIKMTGSRTPRPYWTFACESCMRCMGYCPNQAVEVSHSFAVIVYLAANLSLPLYLLTGIGKIVPSENIFFFLNILVSYIYKLSVFFAAYHILSQLIRNPLINKLFTYTTLTHIFRRYHEPDTSLADIIKHK